MSRNSKDKHKHIGSFRRIVASCLAAAALVFVLACASHTTAKAGFGDYNDYSDSGWDSGSDSGWDSGSDSDWGSDSGSNYYYVSDGDSSGGGIDYFTVLVFIVIIVLWLYIRAKKKGNSGSSSVPGANAKPLVIEHDANFDASTFPNRDSEIESKIKETDPDFSSKDFIAFVKNCYMDIQDAWSKRDLEPVRAILQENLYNQTTAQVEKKKSEGIINALESIAIGNAYSTFLSRDEQFEYITVYLVAKMIDYQYKEDTGEVIRGNKTTRWELAYRMRFQRPLGTKTGENTKIQAHTCPHCGAPLEAGASIKCPYCGSVINTGRNDWVLAEFQTVQRSMTDEGIKW